MSRRSGGGRVGRPSKGPRVVRFSRLPLAAERPVKDLASLRGVTWSEIGAELLTIGLQRRGALVDPLPLQLRRAEVAELTVRIPPAIDQQVRELALDLDRGIGIVSGALIQVGLRYATDLTGQLPAQYPTHSEARLTTAS